MIAVSGPILTFFRWQHQYHASAAGRGDRACRPASEAQAITQNNAVSEVRCSAQASGWRGGGRGRLGAGLSPPIARQRAPVAMSRVPRLRHAAPRRSGGDKPKLSWGARGKQANTRPRVAATKAPSCLLFCASRTTSKKTKRDTREGTDAQEQRHGRCPAAKTKEAAKRRSAATPAPWPGRGARDLRAQRSCRRRSSAEAGTGQRSRH